MKISINKTVLYTIINLTFAIVFLLLNIINFKCTMLVSLISFVIYLCFLDEKNLVTNQIILMLVLNVVYDILFRKTRIDVPLELKYLVDFISLILLLKILIKNKKYKAIWKDKIFLLVFIFVVYSLFIAFSQNVSIVNYIMSLRIYIRFVPMYIIIAKNDQMYSKYDFYLFILTNIFLILIQMKISYYDDVAGVFGISNVQTLLLFLIILSAIISTLYSRKKINFLIFIFLISIIFLVCGVGEIKIGFAIIPIIIVIMILVNSINPIKIITAIATIAIMSSIGLNILIKVSPAFVDFFNPEKLKQNIINYTMKTNNSEYFLGRIENIVYSHNYILTQKSEKIFGLGIGSSMPPETYYFELPKHNKGRERVQLYLTDLFKEYGPYFGYHFSSMNLIYLENGYIGILVCWIIMILGSISGIKLMKKSKNIIDVCIGSSIVSLTVALIGLLFYYNYIINRSAMMLFVFVLALNTNRVRKLK